jgi:hypothetical protein
MLKAGEKQQEYDMLILRNAIEHKERWGPIFEEARRLGKAPPKVYPHPDDLLIRADGSVKVMGPLTADEARLVDKCLQMRDQIFDVVRQVINERGSIFSTERRLAYWISFRRKYYRFSNRIPKRLKIPFPPFELHPHDDDDE